MIKNILFSFAFLWALAGCSQKNSPSATNTQFLLLSPKDFAKQLTTEKGILLDVRTPGEWKKGHLKDARHLDIFRDDFEDEISKLDTNITVFVYCASGGRSSEASDMMRKKGFQKIIDMDGGFMRWKNEGLPSEQ
ncbi:MAG TPA: rhodanese-like domain-containing protein [Bacteroidetes bacterium]|jgi:rhodanese-related sulfurtransferase|nr:rhodanese-like domain-containing protein [Bacteroidota bacterium]